MRAKLLFFLVSALASVQAFADISGSIALTTDYLFKGESLSDEKPALQPSIEYAADSGFYLGAWASNVNFSADDQFNRAVKYASTELDLLTGYRWEAGDISLDTGYVHYSYFGSNDSIQADQSRISASDVNYYELYFTASKNNTTIGYWFAPEYSGLDNKHSIFFISQNISLPSNFNLVLTANYLLNHDDNNFYQQGSSSNYTHFSVALKKSMAELDWTFALETQNNSHDFGSRIVPVLTVSLPF